MGSFGGLSGLFGGGGAGEGQQFIPTPKLIIGHVLEVCLNSSSPMYKDNDQNIGLIKFRDVFGPPTSELGKEKGTTAFPADRTNFKIPLPGEQVLVYQAYIDLISPSSQLVPAYFYGAVITNTANITTNSSPFIGISPNLLKTGTRSATFAQIEKRFEKRIQNLAVFKDSNSKPIIHKQIQPFEGDYILQGRFGNSIRFGSTPTDNAADSGPTWTSKRRGKPGDSIITIRVSNDTVQPKDVKKDIYDLEDINEDAASIYLTTTQEIPFALAVPDKGNREHPLASWAYVYGVSAPNLLDSETHMYDGEQNNNAESKQTPKASNNPTAPKDGNPATNTNTTPANSTSDGGFNNHGGTVQDNANSGVVGGTSESETAPPESQSP